MSREPEGAPGRGGGGWRLVGLGDSAVAVELGDRIDRSIAARVQALDASIRAEIAAGRLPGAVESVPTYRSVAVLYDSRVARRAGLEASLARLAEAAGEAPAAGARAWRLPVTYGGAAGPDLEAVARTAGVAASEAVALHAGVDYTVYVLGFLPGFAFMGDVAEPLRVPRLPEPRRRVPRGSVAVAGQQTAVYPVESPGGWSLLGRCPVPLFDHRRAEPALLAPGDRVSFTPASEEACRDVEDRIAAGRLAPDSFRVA